MPVIQLDERLQALGIDSPRGVFGPGILAVQFLAEATTRP
jgi:hypothetical protein